MGDAELLIVRHVEPDTARDVQAYLRRHGIDAELLDPPTRLIGRGAAGLNIRLAVPRRDLDRAEALLLERDRELRTEASSLSRRMGSHLLLSFIPPLMLIGASWLWLGGFSEKLPLVVFLSWIASLWILGVVQRRRLRRDSEEPRE